MKNEDQKPVEAGLPGDPAIFKFFTEMSIISNLGDHLFERAMAGKLTVAQFGVLNHLLWSNTRKTIGELAVAFQVAQPTMSSTVKKLLDKGCVELIPDTEDRRVRRVAVTGKGRAMREDAVKAMAPGIAKLEAALPDADWKGMLPFLTQLRMLLDKER